MGNEEYFKPEHLLSSISIGMLDNIIAGVFTPNTSIRFCRKVFQLFDLFDLNNLNDITPDSFIRVYIIQRVSKAKLETKTSDVAMLAASVYTGFGSDVGYIFEILNQVKPISNEELTYIEKFISSRLKFHLLFQHSYRIQEDLLRLQTGDFMDLDRLCDENIEPNINELLTHLREVKRTHHDNDFDLSKESMEKAAYQAKNASKEGSVIRLGVKALNALYSDKYGAETSRFYLTLGLPGMWKSGYLWEVASMAQRYNPNMITNDPTKKPAILYISSENTFLESVERILTNKTGSYEMINQMDPVEMVNILRTTYEFNDEYVQVYFKFRKNREITVLDIYDMCQEIGDMGYEVRLIVQDYLNRMEAVNKSVDERIRLINLTNECRDCAVELDVAWMTASQLNREAMVKLDEMAKQNVADPVKYLSSSQVGEAWGIIQIVDHADIIIPQEYRDTNTGNLWKYICFKNLKHRGRLHPWMQSSREFVHPRVPGNDMLLHHDLYDQVSASRMTLANPFDNTAAVKADKDGSEKKKNGNDPELKNRMQNFMKKHVIL